MQLTKENSAPSIIAGDTITFSPDTVYQMVSHLFYPRSDLAIDSQVDVPAQHADFRFVELTMHINDAVLVSTSQLGGSVGEGVYPNPPADMRGHAQIGVIAAPGYTFPAVLPSTGLQMTVPPTPFDAIEEEDMKTLYASSSQREAMEFIELLDRNECKLCTVNAKYYAYAGHVPFSVVALMARAYGQQAVGYQLQEGGPVVLNPPKDEEVRWPGDGCESRVVAVDYME